MTCLFSDDLSSKRDFVLTKKRNKMANKSDELATKEMPFRCYVGYDSHEDITFEVSLRVFVSYSVSFLLLSEEEEEEEEEESREASSSHQSVASLKMISLALL